MNTRHRFRSLALAGCVATLAVVAACESDPASPYSMGDAMVNVPSVQFANADPVLGSAEIQTVVVSNQGTGPLVVDRVALEGADAGTFTLTGASAPFNLEAGQSREFRIAFDPAAAGSYSASLAIEVDDGMDDMIAVPITASSSRFTFAQVDRKGIPALNTVFNHPSGIGPFDKTAYNTASPSNDVANYRDLFIVVLDAVANPNSEGTADLLLPDELPVNMGAPTAFANLTGRALRDDATDVALLVTVGVPGLQSDNVSSNDKSFLGSFPYLALPH